MWGEGEHVSNFKGGKRKKISLFVTAVKKD